MNHSINRKKIIVLSLMLFGFFSISLGSASAAIGDIGHWRDSAGGQIPGTTFSSVNFATEIRNDGIYSRPDTGTIRFDEAGDYLVIASMRDNDNSNGRYNSQARVSLTSGTANSFSSMYSGYSRDSSEDQSWTRAVGVFLNASAGAEVQIQKRRDSDAPTGGSVLNRSDVQVVKINPTNYGLYNVGGTGNLYGGIAPATVSLDAISAESDTAAIEANVSTNTITLKGDNRHYLIAWSNSFRSNSGNTRTQRIGHLEYDGVDQLSTRAYCYRRNAANEYCGLGSMDIVEVAAADREVQLELFRGVGVAADQGGANNQSNITTDGQGRLVVLELPESLEILRSHDSTGHQDITAAQSLNVVRDIDFNYSYSFSKESDSEIDIFHPSSLLAWSNVWTARQNIASGSRQTTYGSISLNGSSQTTGEHGSYSRGNQSTTDTFAMSYHPAGIFTTSSSGDNIGVNSTPLAGGEPGGNDRTQPDTVGFFLLDLETFIAPLFSQSSYRLFENTNSSSVGAPLAAQNTAATLSSAGQGFRLRSLVHVENNKLRTFAEDFKLQFSEKVGSCDASFVGENYIDVSSSTAISFNTNSSVADGSLLLADPNDPVNGINLVVSQSYNETNDFSATNSNVEVGQDGKWDFSLRDNGASPDSSYCFRIVRSDGSLLDTYSEIPEITTAPVPPAFCPAPITSFPYSEGFEGGAVGAWEQSVLDDNDWFNHTLSTPSGGTGPSAAAEGARYVYVEASTDNGAGGSGNPNKRSILTSPCFELPADPHTFDFQYHMFGGSTFGNFDLEISTNGSTWTSLFNQTSNQGNQWNQESIDLSSYLGQQVRFRLNRFVSTSWQSDVAIDDIAIREIPLGSAASNPFTSLAQAQSLVSVTGVYYFNLNGETFNTIVDENGWVLVASGESTTTETSYSQVDALNFQTDLILSSDIVAEMTEATELRINATSGPNIPFDVTSSSSTALSRFLAYTSIGFDPNVNPLDSMFNGTDPSNVLAPSSACNGGSQSLDLKIMHNCGNSNGIHWIPGSSVEDLNNGTANDLNLWVRAATVSQELTFSLSDNSIGFGLLDVLSTKFASGDLLGSITSLFSHSASASTNAANGYEIEIEASDFACTSCDVPGAKLDPIGAIATPASPGLEQFGLRVVPGGTGSVNPPYGGIDYAHDLASGASVVLSGAGDNINTDFDFEYIADIDPLTPAGEYEMLLTYTMHATF